MRLRIFRPTMSWISSRMSGRRVHRKMYRAMKIPNRSQNRTVKEMQAFRFLRDKWTSTLT